ncbi:phage holin family protein [Allosediminivita pacifica]|uniref:Putative superfamily III holin-X n=1 Tax=Allosediminivita pacifica TaxID=1267769 RepID=A0A2T6ABC9_9RHOB|nr:phage holin family protein [Allosediminivita pacifica]PTX41111.1 putative superfamily III holin-X [Allosediminivita pacifica]GGB25061.1 hypothetical protein GCM10011324_38770 [Allosediminivita pacifica]
MLHNLEWTVRSAIKRGATFLIGLLFVLIGAGFLTHAAFLALAEWRDTIFALQVLGGVYFVIGGIFMFMSRRPRVPVPPAPMTAAATPGLGGTAMLVLAEAFMSGIDAGRSARARRKEPLD